MPTTRRPEGAPHVRARMTLDPFVTTLFHDTVLCTWHPPVAGERAPRTDGAVFRVGQRPQDDAPAPETALSGESHILLAETGGTYQLTPAQGMTVTGPSPGAAPGDSLIHLRPGQDATVSCGHVRYLIGWQPPPQVVARPSWRRRLVGAALALIAGGATALVAVYLGWLAAPLSAPVGWAQARALPEVVVIPAQPPPTDASNAGTAAPAVQETTRRAELPRKPAASRSGGGRRGRPGHEDAPAGARDPRLAGIVGQLLQSGQDGGALAALLGPGYPDPLAEALVGLGPGFVDSGYGPGGLAVNVPGASAGETLGDGRIDTGGTCTGANCTPGALARGDARARLGPRGTRRIDVIPSVAQQRGSLDKELVRRTIRSHLNEVRYCYETELVRNPRLAGRLAVEFMIDPRGQVVASAIKESSLANPRVEACVATAVRRWQFPVARAGGATIVTYPLVFAAAGL